MAGRGRPKTGRVDRKSVRVTEEVWQSLVAIAEREGLTWGDQPAPGLAVGWLVERDSATQSRQS